MRIKIGLYSIGLDTYWDQFDGLKEHLSTYHKVIHKKLENFGATVIDVGLIDNPKKALSAGSRFRSEEVELIFLYISTYALSSTVLPVVQKAGVPVVVLSLQPTAQLDYEAFNIIGDRGAMTGVWLEHCQACCTPEISNVFRRAQIPYYLVMGHLQDEVAWSEINDWVRAAIAKRGMSLNRVGLLGHYYCGMLDVYSDLTQQSASFGNHFEFLEMCELKNIRDQVTDGEVQDKRRSFDKSFVVA